MIVLQAPIEWLDLAATIVLAGGVIYAAAIAPPSPAGRRAIRWAIGMIAVALALELAVTAVRLSSLSTAAGWPFAAGLLSTHWGVLWIVRTAGLAVVAVSIRVGWGFAAVPAILWLLPRSLQGHAGAQGTIPALIDWAHLLAAAVWLGSLLQFACASRETHTAAAARLRLLATISLAVLVPAGLYGAFLHVPSLGRLVTTTYGRALVTKLVVAVALIGLGASNHFRHIPALRFGRPEAAGRLRRAVRAEVMVGAIVILLSALLGLLPLPRG